MNDAFVTAFLAEMEKIGFSFKALKERVYPNPLLKQDIRAAQHVHDVSKQQIQELTKRMNAAGGTSRGDAEFSRDKAINRLLAAKGRIGELSGQLSRVRKKQALAIGGGALALGLGGLGTALAVRHYKKKKAARQAQQEAKAEEGEKRAGLKETAKRLWRSTPWGLGSRLKDVKGRLAKRRQAAEAHHRVAGEAMRASAEEIEKHKGAFLRLSKSPYERLKERALAFAGRGEKFMEEKSKAVPRTFRRRRLMRLSKAYGRKLKVAPKDVQRIRMPKSLFEALQHRASAKEAREGAIRRAGRVEKYKGLVDKVSKATDLSKSRAAKLALGAGGVALLAGGGLLARHLWKKHKKAKEEENQPQYEALREWEKSK